MKQLIHNITTSISLPRALARRLALLLAVLLVGVVNVWGKDRTWTATVAVTAGKGTATAKIYVYNVFSADEQKASASATSSQAKTASYKQTVGWLASFSSHYPEYSQNPATGYSFVGWYNTSDTRVSQDDTYYPRTGLLPHGATSDAWSCTYYAKFSPNSYTIVFNKNNGSGSMPNQSFTYDVGQNLSTNSFTREGYTFDGWATSPSGAKVYDDGQYVINLTTTSNATVTLYARWKANTYTVALDKNTGTGGTQSVTATYGSNMPSGATAPSKTGYTFQGYFDAKDGGTKYYDANMASAHVWDKAANTTLYARWTVNTYTIVFDANDGTGTKSNQSFTYGEENNLTANAFSRTGYIFAGWNTDSGGGGTSYSDKQKVKNLTATNNGTVTLYAQWTPISYAIAFNGNGSTVGSMSNINNCKYGQAVLLSSNTFVRKGYTFAGWRTAANGNGTLYADGATVTNLTATNGVTVTLFAQWTANKYTVTLNQKGGSGGSTSVTATYDAAMPAATAPTKTGYTFQGYFDADAASDGTQYYNANMSSAHIWDKTANATLYARWTANTYTIAFDANNGSGTMSNLSCTYDVDKTLTNNAFTRTGYTFAGWNTMANGSGAGYANGATVRNLTATNGATVTLFAQWTPNAYKVTLDNNTGSGGTSSVTATYDAAMPSATAPTKTGYTFQGYFDSKTEGTKYYNADMTSARTWDKTAATTLYARWTANQYTVTLNGNGGSGGTASVTATYDVAMPAATAHTRTGYTFQGYYDTSAASGGTQYYNADMSSARTWNKAANTTLYARWAANTYTVTFNQNYSGAPAATTIPQTYDAKYVLPTPNPTRTGHTFLGWFTSATAGEGVQVTTAIEVKITSAQTLYAHWDAIFDFNVTAGYVDINTNSNTTGWGSSNVSGITAHQEIEGVTSSTQTATFTAVPVDVNCTFEGWYSKANIDPSTDTPVSTSATYTTNVTNSTPGSTVALHLYAYYKHNQTIHWDNDINLSEPIVVGQSQTNTSATASGSTVTYVSSNPSALSVATNGDLTPHAEVNGTVCIRAMAGNELYNTVSLERCFIVDAKKTPVITPASGTFYKKVDESITIALAKVSDGLNGDFSVSASPSGIVSWTRSGNVLTISCDHPGTTTLTLTQTENNLIFGATATYTIEVTRYDNTLKVTTGTYDMFVGDELGDIINGSHIAIKDRNNNDEAVMVTSDDPNLLSYDPATDRLSATNSGNEMFGASKDVTLIFSQPVTNKYTAASETIRVTVKKYPNTITVNGSSSYSTNLKFTEEQNISISSTNTNGPEREVTQTAGQTTAEYSGNGTSGKVTALYTEGTAKWNVTQAEDYKYQAGSATITATVKALAETDCDVLPNQGEITLTTHSTSWWGEQSNAIAIPAGYQDLCFKIRHNSALGIDAVSDYMYIEYSKDGGSNWSEEEQITGWSTRWSAERKFSIPAGVTHFRFNARVGSTLSHYFKDIHVTRKTYFSATESSLDFGTTLENNTVTRQFYVEWSSSNTGDIHLSSTNPHFRITNPTNNVISNTDCRSDRTLVEVTYLADEHPINSDIIHNGTIFIYDKGRVDSVKVTGTTQPQYNLVVSGQDRTIQVEDNLNLSDIITYWYKDNNVVPAAPTHGVGSSPFYFTISQESISDNTDDCIVPGTVVTYDSEAKSFHACNAGKVTLTFTQVENTGDTAVHAGMIVGGVHCASVSYTITVKKHDPTFTWTLPNAEWASKYKFSNYFSSNNEATSWSAVSNTDIAVYRSSTDSIYTNYRSGDATFTVTQVENYYWNEKVQDVTTTVAHGEENECYLYESPLNEEIKVWNFMQATWQDTAVAGKVIFDARRSSTDVFHWVSLSVNEYINGNSHEVMSFNNHDDSYEHYEHDLNDYATGLLFKDGFGQVVGEFGNYTNRVKNVKVTRVPWIKASATDVTLPTIGKQGHSEATVTVYWSGVEPLRIEKKTNNPHFDVSPDAYFVQTPCTSGFSVLTLAYHSDEPGNETETIVIYDHAHSLEITLHGTTENKEMQEIVWNQSFNPILALGGTIDADSLLTAYATNRQGARTNQPITYTVGNTSIATIENGNHLHITNIGRTTITATVAGNGNYSGATKTLILNVLDGTGCGSLAFSNESEVTLFTITSDDALAVTRPAEDLYFEAKRDWIAFLNPAAQHVKMRYKVKGDNNWKTQDENGVEIETGALNSDWGSYGPFRLPENTEGIQFYTEFGAYFSQHVRNVYITQRSYLRKDKDALTANILVNTLTEVGEFTVEYSDKPTLIVENKCSNVKLFVDNPAPNECGTAGKYTYSVSCFSDTIGIIKDTVTVTSGLDDKLSVPVTIYVGIDGEFFFDNGIDHDITHTDWNVTQYWRKDNVYDHGRIPTMASLTTIEGPTVIDYDAYAYKMTITGSGKVTIAPNGSLKVGAGGIHGATMSNLILEADNTGQTGILRLYPGIADEKIPDALVQIYTTAYWDRENGKKAVWQYIGTPVRNPDTNEHIFYQCWLYQYNQSLDKWKNAGNWGHMVPFQAYAFTRDKKSSGPLTGFGGQLNTLSIQNVDLTYIDKDHCENHLANSWTAPIYLKQFKPTDFQNVDPIIYCYTIEGKGLAKEIAVYTSDYTGNDILPAMQGFFVKARSNENPQLLLDYERLVWKNETSKNAPLRAPSRMNEEESDLSARICIQMTSADMVTDRIYLLEKDGEGFSPDYEVGYDAPKYFVDGLPCIYTYETSGPHLAVSATDDVVGTYLAINTGASQDYTLTFSKVIGEGLGLRDLVTNTIVPITEGMQYAFTAPANSSPMLRFVVVEHEETPQWNNNNGTSLEDLGGEFKIWQSGEILSVIGAGSHASLRIYDAAGKLILSEFFNEATAINLNALPTGVYMVQVNDKTEKVLR